MGPSVYFMKLDRQSVIGRFEATGSRDPDVLFAAKADLVAKVRRAQVGGTLLMGLGVPALVAKLIPLAVILVVAGWLLRQRGSANVRTVETAYLDFVNLPP